MCSARDLHSYTEQHLLLGSGTAHSGLGPPGTISNPANPQQTFPQANLILPFPQPGLSSQVTLSGLKLTVKVNQDRGLLPPQPRGLNSGNNLDHISPGNVFVITDVAILG